MKNIINKNCRFNDGFTLAEVLITIVIIGVIAAITIPNLIQKHRKMLVETRLKAAYSVLSNMFKAAEVDYGSFSSWDLDSYFNVQSSSDSSLDIHNSFIRKYLLPYLRFKNFDEKTLAEFGYKNGILNPNGTVRHASTKRMHGIFLGNGSFFVFNPNIMQLSSGKHALFDLWFIVDINGPKNGPNTIAKDIFAFQKMPAKDYPLTLFGEYSNYYCWDSSTSQESLYNFVKQNKCVINVNPNTGVFTFYPEFRKTRDEIMTNCKKGDENSFQCGALILRDGWKISDDYPWSV